MEKLGIRSGSKNGGFTLLHPHNRFFLTLIERMFMGSIKNTGKWLCYIKEEKQDIKLDI